ncbi:MAG: outer membrane protein transport protein [Deltaproteobacteria bacterium]|nr:outer membrane protein transport protein [Deltaproteobacteria bacterium]
MNPRNLSGGLPGGRWRHRLAAMAFLSAALLLPAAARAQSPAIQFGLGSKSMALGGAVSAHADDFAAVFYNPAGLANKTDLQLSAGPQLVIPSFRIQSFSGTRKGSTKTFLANNFGGVVPIGGPFERKLAIGLAAYTPFPTIVSIRIRTPEEPSFVFSEDQLQTPVIAFGAAYRVNQYFSFGAGGQLLVTAKGKIRTSVDLANAAIRQRDTSITIAPTLAPILGVQITPIRYLKLGMFYRGKVKPDFDLPIDVDADIIGFSSSFTSSILFSPAQLGGGLSFEVLEKLILSTDFVYVFSSETPSPGIALRITPTALVAPIVTIDPDPNFSNTYELRAGVEYKLNEDIRFRAGYFRRTSPAPEQVFDTSFLDSTANGFSIGTGVTLKDPTEILQKPFTIDNHFQWTQYQRRTYQRESPLHPIGDLRFKGRVFNIGATFTVRF